MPVITTDVSHSYHPGAAMAPEAIPFQFLDSGDLTVTLVAAATGVRQPLVESMSYVIAGHGPSRTGRITATGAWPAGDLFVVERTTALTQETIVKAHEPVPADGLTRQLDRTMMAAQEQSAGLVDLDARAIRVPAGEAAPMLPRAGLRTGGGKVLGPNPLTGAIEVLPGDVFRGAPGGNTMAIGPLLAAPGLAIPIGTDLVQTSGFLTAGRGYARYAYDPAVDVAHVAAHPLTSFRSANGRGFRLAEDVVTPQMFGAVGDGITPDDDAFAATVAYAGRGNREIRIPSATYRLTRILNIRPFQDAFPFRSLSFVGEQSNGVVLLLDFDGAEGVVVNKPVDEAGAVTSGYTRIQQSRVGNFTVRVAPGRKVLHPFKELNAADCDFSNIAVQFDWTSAAPAHVPEGEVECIRVSSGVQWCRHTSLAPVPYNLPGTFKPNPQPGVLRGFGINIGNGYRDIPSIAYAISNNSFYDCTTNELRVGFQSEAADGTTTYNTRAVQCDYNIRDGASFGTIHINPWDEGALVRGFDFYAANVRDSTGNGMRKTQYPIVSGSYIGSVYLDGVIGADLVIAANRLEVTAACQRGRIRLMGADSVVVIDDNTDCEIKYFRTSDNRHVQTISGFENSYETPSGTKLLTLSDAKGVGLVLKTGIEPTIANELVLQKVTDTQVTMRFRGSDGVVRNLTGIAGNTLTFA